MDEETEQTKETNDNVVAIKPVEHIDDNDIDDVIEFINDELAKYTTKAHDDGWFDVDLLKRTMKQFQTDCPNMWTPSYCLDKKEQHCVVYIHRATDPDHAKYIDVFHQEHWQAFRKENPRHAARVTILEDKISFSDAEILKQNYKCIGNLLSGPDVGKFDPPRFEGTSGYLEFGSTSMLRFLGMVVTKYKEVIFFQDVNGLMVGSPNLKRGHWSYDYHFADINKARGRKWHRYCQTYKTDTVVAVYAFPPGGKDKRNTELKIIETPDSVAHLLRD